MPISPESDLSTNSRYCEISFDVICLSADNQIVAQTASEIEGRNDYGSSGPYGLSRQNSVSAHVGSTETKRKEINTESVSHGRSKDDIVEWRLNNTNSVA